jgi:hypothetical protein
MVFLGDISYSLYLWHWPIIVLWKRYSGGGIGYLDGPAIAVASIILAWLTKVLVEDRVRLAPFITRSPVRSLATVLAVAVPVAFVAVFIASEPPPFSGNLDAKHPGAAVLAGDVPVPASASPEPPLISAPRDFAISSNSTCLSASSVPSRCEFGDQKAPVATVALVGDSLAGQWSSVLDVIAKKQHWRLVVETHSGCPFGATVIVHPGSGGKPDTGCHDWGTAVLRDLLTDIKPDVVITSDSPTDGTLADPKANSTARAEIGSGMADYWKQLQAAGISVVAIAESPSMVGSGPDCLSSRTGSVKSCSRPAAKAIFHATPLEKAASLAPSSRLIDLNSLICGKTTCLPVVGNVVVYRDQHHLTKTYTLTLEPYLRKLLLAVQALKPAGG